MKRPVPDEVILGLLASTPAHGYDLLETFRSHDQLGHVWTLSTSQLYAVLKRLEGKGAIVGEQEESIGAPVRMVYSVTEKGYKQLRNWLFEKNPSPSIHRIRVLFLSRLFIADLLGIGIKNIVENQRTVCKKQLISHLEEKQKASSSFEKLTLDFIIVQLQSALSWLDQCEHEFSNKPG
jgi:DNA-binding PadR family transcriptional regulator